MLTGLWPSGHGVPRNGWPLAEDVATLPERLALRKVACAAFVSSAALDPRFGLGRGFDPYDYEGTRRVEREQGWRPAGETLARALEWWRSNAQRPRFLFVHLFEPHFPYEPDPRDLAVYAPGDSMSVNGSMDFLFALWADPKLLTPDARAQLEALYHAEMTGLDRTLGPALEELTRDQETLVVVVADHGESMGEHELDFKHGPNVYASDVHVPLAIVGGPPGPPDRARVDDALVRTIDLAPTIAAALGVPDALPEASESRDLASIRPGEDLVVFGEASMPWNVELAGEYPNRHKQKVIRTRRASLVATPWSRRIEWYDRDADPGELIARAVPPSEEPQRLTRLLAEWGSRGAPREQPTGIDPALVEQLHGLGYVDR